MIAVLLVGRNHCSEMIRCLESLHNSATPQFVLYYFDNASQEHNLKAVKDFCSSRNVGLVWRASYTSNLGIVIPRLRLMNLIQESGPNHELVLDIHSDMLFPSMWWRALVEDTGFRHDPLMAVAYPSLFQSPKAPSQEELEYHTKQCRSVKEDAVVYDPVQTQPLVVKTSILGKIGGYLDPAFHPMFVDDDDFRCRVWKAGLTAVGSRASWVWHQGGMQSWGKDSLEPTAQNNLLRRNQDLFKVKHGMEVSYFKEAILGNQHPVVRLGDT